MKIDKRVYANGIRFECTGCGQCCKARHGYGYIYVTLDERRRLARHLGMTTAGFTRKHCQREDDAFHLRDPARDCRFLDDKRCTVYPARPGQCRSWPFWPENMSRRVWEREVKRDCPGVGQGRLHSAEEIDLVLQEEQVRARRS